MTGRLVGAAFRLQGMSPTSKLVLAKLADAANASGYCWPSVAKISLDTGLSERCVRNNLRLLQSAGHIRIERRMRGRRQTSNGYVLLLDISPACDAGTENAQVQVMPEPDAGDTCTISSPILSPNEPSMNLPPINGCDTPAMMARVTAFREAIGLHHFEAWFKDAAFREGPPVTILFVRKTAFSIAPARYRENLKKYFGDDFVASLFAPQSTAPSKSETGAR